MLIYTVLLIWLLLIQFVRKNRLVYICTYFFLLLLGGFRGIDVGTDTNNYQKIYETLHNDAAVSYVMTQIEPLWVLLNILVINLYDNFQVIIFLGIFGAITPVFIRLWKSCDHPYVGVLFYVLLYYYFSSYNVVRQMIAVSIIFYSYPFWNNGKYPKAYICTIVAALFHVTAIFAIFIPLFKKIKLQISLIIFILPITYVLGVVVMPHIIPLLPLGGKYVLYLESDSGGSFSITRLLLNVFFVVLVVASRGEGKDLYFKMLLVGILCYNLFPFHPALGRSALFFMFSQLIIYSNLARYKLNSISVIIIILSYGLFYYYVLLAGNNCDVIPYRLGEI